MAKVLLVEDDTELLDAISDYLTNEGYTVERVENGEEAHFRLSTFAYDVVVLDWTIPKITGIEVLKQYRNMGGKTPILMLTGRGNVEDKEAGLDSGSDDYLTKPFSMRELSARLRSLLRRPVETLKSNTLIFHGLALETATRKLTIDNVEIHLLPRDFTLLEFLMRNPDQIFSNDALLDRVWHSESNATEDSLRSSFKRIRKKIGDTECNLIENVPKIGYRFNSK